MNNLSMKTKTSTLLKCRVTGETRRSNQKYISAKAEANNTTPEEWSAYYVTKPTILSVQSDLNEMGIKPVLAKLDMDGETLDKVLRFNGKSKKSLDDYKKATAPKQVQVTVPASQEPASQEESAEEVVS